jgi:hypothetical protein
VPLKRGKKRRVALQSGISRPTMERLWSLAVATSGNRWQMDGPRKRGNQAKTVAVGCDQLPKGMVRRGSTVRVRQRASAFSLLRHRFRFQT